MSLQWRTAAIAGAVAMVLSAAPNLAGAQGFDPERFVPAAGAASDLTVESPQVTRHLTLGVGLFLDLADDPLVLRDQATDELVARPLDTSLTTNVLLSLGLFDFAELGVHLPVHFIYDGDALSTPGGAVAAGGGVGDLRLVPKFELFGGGDAGHHALVGLAIPVSLPTGDAAELRGTDGLSVSPMLSALWQIGRVGIAGNAGLVLRGERPAGLAWGHELRGALSLSYEVVPEAFDLHAELFGGHQLSTDSDEGPNFGLEGLFGVVLEPGDDWRIYAAAGPGIAKGLGVPDFRGVLGVRFSPGVSPRHGFADSDGDGILDRDDDCPEEAEDADGFRDDDGCPEPDNDGDGILDDDDECPELPDDDNDGDGCPSRTYVEIVDGEMVIFGKIRFRTGSAELDRESQPLLDQIAVALQANPQVEKVIITGHTDNIGDADFNDDLSEDRAEAVEDALIERGVDGDRLETRGYGERKPIAPNRTPAGRAKNRRVEFIISQ